MGSGERAEKRIVEVGVEHQARPPHLGVDVDHCGQWATSHQHTHTEERRRGWRRTDEQVILPVFVDLALEVLIVGHHLHERHVLLRHPALW